MLSTTPRALETDDTPAPVLEAPTALVERYLELTRARRHLEDQLAYVRSELEMVAAATLRDDAPRGRFVSRAGTVAARLHPTCVFDKPTVARELQRMGKLADVAIVQGPTLARYLAKEPIVAARLGEMVRPRRSVVLLAGSG